MHYVIGPAYGRNYTTAEQARTDFETGKDFVNHTVSGPRGRYMSIRNTEDGDTVEIRDITKQKILFVGKVFCQGELVRGVSDVDI